MKCFGFNQDRRFATCSPAFSCRKIRADLDDDDFRTSEDDPAWNDADDEDDFDPEPIEGDGLDDDPEESDPPDELWNDGDWE